MLNDVSKDPPGHVILVITILFFTVLTVQAESSTETINLNWNLKIDF
jgi:hypothetical protein